MASRSSSNSSEVQATTTVEQAVARVTLRNSFAHPYDSAIAAARTCYAPRLISPDEITEKQRTTIGAATYYAGHHTVYQHAHFEFGLENVSRQFGAAEKEIFERAIARAWSAYRELTALLKDDTRRILADIWNIGTMSHPRRIEKVERQAEKRAIEVARYVLPVAAATTMVHTLSGVVLHRLWR